ncbi:hypothetical protein BH09PLA1_BH09PLA1_22740 [soil metagenome]
MTPGVTRRERGVSYNVMRNYRDDMTYRILIVLMAIGVAGCSPPGAANSGGGHPGSNNAGANNAGANNVGGPAGVERINDTFGLGQWKYITRDGEGNSLTEGLLTLPYPLQEGARFFGSWQARYIGPINQQDKIGPQINGGKLSGELTDGQLILQMNPNMNDNNVRFIAKVEGDRIVGDWEYSNFSGLAAKGTFEALLSKE